MANTKNAVILNYKRVAVTFLSSNIFQILMICIWKINLLKELKI